MKNLDTLIEDIYKTIAPLGKRESIGITDEHIEEFGESMKGALKEWAFYQGSDKPTLRMSNIGKPSRQLWFDMNSEQKNVSFSPPTLIKFLYGHILEQMVLFFVKLSGHEVTHEQKSVKVSGISGHMDCVIDGEVIDVKSTSGFSFYKFKKGTLPEKDPFGYMAQLAGYEEGMKTEHGGFIAINKETGELCLFRPEELDKPDIKSRIKDIKAIIKKPAPPELCYQPEAEGVNGNFKLPTNCKYCRHKFECHKDSNNGKGLRVFQYARGPTYFTQVMVEPKVKEITNERKKIKTN